MWKQLFDYYFWFSQPATILTKQDNIIGFIFLGLMAVAIILRISAYFNSNLIDRKLLMKLWYVTFVTALTGLIWLGIRYENTPIFAKRFWAGLNLIFGIVWLLFVVKYLVFNYRQEKSVYERELIKNKYLPKAK